MTNQHFVADGAAIVAGLRARQAMQERLARVSQARADVGTYSDGQPMPLAGRKIWWQLAQEARGEGLRLMHEIEVYNAGFRAGRESGQESALRALGLVPVSGGVES